MYFTTRRLIFTRGKLNLGDSIDWKDISILSLDDKRTWIVHNPVYGCGCQCHLLNMCHTVNTITCCVEKDTAISVV